MDGVTCFHHASIDGVAFMEMHKKTVNRRRVYNIKIFLIPLCFECRSFTCIIRIFLKSVINTFTKGSKYFSRQDGCVTMHVNP